MATISEVLKQQEGASLRTLTSKTFDNGNGTKTLIAGVQGKAIHYKESGLTSDDPWLDIDLSNVDDLKTLYKLVRNQDGIGYHVAARELNWEIVSVTMQDVDVSSITPVRTSENGVERITWPGAFPDCDIYMEPKPYRFGIFKVLFSANSPRVFRFQLDGLVPSKLLTTDNQEINRDTLIGKMIDGEAVSLEQAHYLNLMLPPALAWDAEGKPIEVRRTLEGDILIEEVVIPEGFAAWPITVDTDVSYYSSTTDGRIKKPWYGNCTVDNSGSYGRIGYDSDIDTRGMFPFDTSGLPTGADVSAATIKLYGKAKAAYNYNLIIVEYTGSIPLTTSDYTNFGTTAFASLAATSWSTSGYNSFSLNATGISEINDAGTTAYGFTYTDGADSGYYIEVYFAEYTGTDKDPKMEITYSEGGTPEAISGRSYTATMSATALNTAVSLSGRSATTPRATAIVAVAVSIAGRAATPTRSYVEVDTPTSIQIRAPTTTRSAAEIQTGISLSGRSATGTRSEFAVNTAVQVEGNSSSTTTRVDAELNTLISLPGRSATATRAYIALDTKIKIPGQSNTNTRSSADIKIDTALIGMSATTTRTDGVLYSYVSLDGRSTTETRANAEVDTAISLAGNSATDNRSQTELDTNILISGKTTTGTRSVTEVDTVIGIGGKSSTSTDASIELSVSSTIAGRSFTNTRSQTTIETGITLSGKSATSTRSSVSVTLIELKSISGRSSTTSRADANLNTEISLAGRSATPTRASVSLAVNPVSLSCITSTLTRADVELGADIAIESSSQTDTRAACSIDTAISILGQSQANSRVNLANMDTIVTLSGQSRTSSRAAASISFPYKQLVTSLSLLEREVNLQAIDREVSISWESKEVNMEIVERSVLITLLERSVYMEVEILPLLNNTVRLKAEFRDFDGNLESPDDVVLRLYDSRRNQLGEDIPVDYVETGLYQYDYIVPSDGIGVIYYEFQGTIDGKPILGRATLQRSWI